MKKRWMVLLAVVLVGLVLYCCQNADKGEPLPDLVLRYADNQPEGYPTTLAAQYFAQLVEERTEGRIRIRVYCDGELGSEVSVLEQLRFGGIDMARLSSAILEGEYEDFSVLTLPYLYENDEHMRRVLEGPVGQRFLIQRSSSGLLGMSWYDAGARSFYTREPIGGLEDLQGKHIRVQESEMMSRMMVLLGAVPEKMSYEQVYSALLTGTVDGAENNLPSYVSTGHSQAAGYFFADEHSRLPEMQLVSTYAMDRIAQVDGGFPALILQCARESAAYERTLWEEQVNASREECLRQGVTIIEPTDEQQEAFRAAVQPLYDELSVSGKALVAEIGTYWVEN